MSDPRLSVLLDLLDELATEGRQGLAEALDTRPELWLQIPRGALVALPWERRRGSSLIACRLAAGAATSLPTSFGTPQLRAARVSSVGGALVVETLALYGAVWREWPVEGWGRRAHNTGPLEAAQAAADAALLAAGWVLL